MKDFKVKTTDNVMYKLYQNGVKKYIALVMIIDGKLECVQAHWNVSDEFAVKTVKELIA